MLADRRLGSSRSESSSSVASSAVSASWCEPRVAASAATRPSIAQMNASGNPVFNFALSKGFTTVFSPSPGILCLAYPAGVTINAPLAISPAGNEPDLWEQVSPGQCSGTGFEIANESGATNLRGELEVLVP